MLAHLLELLLLFRVEQRGDLGIDRGADLPQSPHLVRATQRGVVLQRLQLRYLFLEDRDDLLLLLFRQTQLLRKILGQLRGGLTTNCGVGMIW